MSLNKVIETAVGEIGKTENPPGSNMNEYGERYGWNGVPWCVQFLWDSFDRGGERAAFFGGAKTASCGILMQYYKERGQMVPVKEAQRGDIGFFNFSGGKAPEHCGLIIEGRPGYVLSVEGNTTATGGSEDNGGAVAEKMRGYAYIVGVARPKYQPEEPEAKDDFTGRWSEGAIRWCMEKGLLTGYPDGSFRPAQAVTREELAAVLQRLAEA